MLRAGGISFAFREALPVLDGSTSSSVAARSSPSRARTGPARRRSRRIVSGLLEPQAGTVELHGRAGYLSQDPGRYLVKETALGEVALAVER